MPEKKYKKDFFGLMEDELAGKIMIKFFGLKAETFICLTDDNIQDKKAKDAKKVYHRKKT